jgi:hypothetical protein
MDSPSRYLPTPTTTPPATSLAIRSPTAADVAALARIADDAELFPGEMLAGCWLRPPVASRQRSSTASESSWPTAPGTPSRWAYRKLTDGKARRVRS